MMLKINTDYDGTVAFVLGAFAEIEYRFQSMQWVERMAGHFG